VADIRTTPQLDTFIRANEDPLSGGGLWVPLDTVRAPDYLQNLSDRGRGKAALSDRFWNRTWSGAPVTGDQEVWGWMDDDLQGSDWCGLGLLTNPDGTDVNHQGYIAYTRDFGGANYWAIYRYDTFDTVVPLLADAFETQYLFDSTLLLLRLNGTHVEYFYSNDDGANWTQLADVVDNTYRASLTMNISLVGMFGNPFFGYKGFGGGAPQPETQVQLPYLGVGP